MKDLYEEIPTHDIIEEYRSCYNCINECKHRYRALKRKDNEDGVFTYLVRGNSCAMFDCDFHDL